jgi:hypothetical protein
MPLRPLPIPPQHWLLQRMPQFLQLFTGQVHALVHVVQESGSVLGWAGMATRDSVGALDTVCGEKRTFQCKTIEKENQYQYYDVFT